MPLFLILIFLLLPSGSAQPCSNQDFGISYNGQKIFLVSKENQTCSCLNYQAPTASFQSASIGSLSINTLIGAPGGVQVPSGTVLDLGYNAAGRDADAGKIGYGAFGSINASDSLNIVGAGSTAGSRKVRLFDRVQVGSLVSIAGSYTCGGLQGSYYQGTSMLGPVVCSPVESVYLRWPGSGPCPVCGGSIGCTGFSARWLGYLLAPTTGTVTLQLMADDGVRLWLGDQQAPLIVGWTDQNSTSYSVNVTTVSGTYYPIRIEFYQNTMGFELSMQWYYASSTLAPIPASNLCTASGVQVSSGTSSFGGPVTFDGPTLFPGGIGSPATPTTFNGPLVFQGPLTAAADVAIAGAVTVQGNGTLSVAGKMYADGGLVVPAGQSVLVQSSGLLRVQGDTELLDVTTADLNVSGALDVVGAVTATGGVAVPSNATVSTGMLTVSGLSNLGAVSSTQLTMSGPVSVAGGGVAIAGGNSLTVDTVAGVCPSNSPAHPLNTNLVFLLNSATGTDMGPQHLAMTTVGTAIAVNQTVGGIAGVVTVTGAGYYSINWTGAGFPTGTSARTMCSWAYLTSGSLGWLMSFGNSGGIMSIGVSGGQFTGAGWGNDLSSGPFTMNTWHHICFVYQPLTSTLYINGQFQATLARTISIATTPFVAYVGAMVNTNERFIGSMYDTRVYRRALTAAEILLLWRTTMAGPLLCQHLQLPPTTVANLAVTGNSYFTGQVNVGAVSSTGTVTATAFVGSGSGLTGLSTQTDVALINAKLNNMVMSCPFGHYVSGFTATLVPICTAIVAVSSLSPSVIGVNSYQVVTITGNNFNISNTQVYIGPSFVPWNIASITPTLITVSLVNGQTQTLPVTSGAILYAAVLVVSNGQSIAAGTIAVLPSASTAVWYEASSQYTQMSVMNVTGTNVVMWKDVSGNARDLTTASGTPQYPGALLNSLPTVRFPGAAWLTNMNTGLGIMAGDFTIIWVNSVVGGSPWAMRDFTNASPVNSDYDKGAVISSGYGLESNSRVCPGQNCFSAANTVSATWKAYAIRLSGFSGEMYQGLTLVQSITTNFDATGTIRAAIISLGARACCGNAAPGNDPLAANSAFAEFMVIRTGLSRTLSGTTVTGGELHTVMSYLKRKWGV